MTKYFGTWAIRDEKMKIKVHGKVEGDCLRKVVAAVKEELDKATGWSGQVGDLPCWIVSPTDKPGIYLKNKEWRIK